MSVDDTEIDTSPLSVIEMVQRERVKLINSDPTNEEAEELDIKVRLEVMRDATRTASDMLKNDVSRENNKEIAQALVNAAASRGSNPFRQVDADTGIPVADIPEVEIMPGEDSREPSNLTYKNTYQGDDTEE